MGELCKLCGEPVENGCHHEFRRMCLNCKSIRTNSEGAQVCGNEENMQAALKPVLDAIQDVKGYQIDVSQIAVTPIPLKRPTNACSKWELSDEVIEYLKTLFV